MIDAYGLDGILGLISISNITPLQPCIELLLSAKSSEVSGVVLVDRKQLNDIKPPILAASFLHSLLVRLENTRISNVNEFLKKSLSFLTFDHDTQLIVLYFLPWNVILLFVYEDHQ